MSDGAKAMSFSAFGRTVGVSPEAVSKAVRVGRLAKSVGVDHKGRRAIVDPELAAKEWKERASKLRSGRPWRVSMRVVSEPTESPEALDLSPERIPAERITV